MGISGGSSVDLVAKRKDHAEAETEMRTQVGMRLQAARVAFC